MLYVTGLFLYLEWLNYLSVWFDFFLNEALMYSLSSYINLLSPHDLYIMTDDSSRPSSCWCNLK